MSGLTFLGGLFHVYERPSFPGDTHSPPGTSSCCRLPFNTGKAKATRKCADSVLGRSRRVAEFKNTIIVLGCVGGRELWCGLGGNGTEENGDCPEWHIVSS